VPQTFNFPYHEVQDEYPESSARLKFGGGYEFASKPTAPDQVVFVLTFPGMWYYENPPGTVNTATNATRNMGALQAFYEAHRLYEKFDYPHPRRGTVSVRFEKPLKTPRVIPKANGLCEPFEVRLIMQP
jgi:hypothetical protein